MLSMERQLNMAKAEYGMEASVTLESMVLTALLIIEKSFNDSVYIHSFSSVR